ncbi:copper chaperone PCu(A)C [Rhizobium sp. S152]|uniref:copper chaperone PCu(A)C n=1 Tax=Rhizobium sp. S152 TaxID=3055038 RepID=UPI0025AA0CB0|nr:copper chaperone PCu(A)C [Rhizobium sp. S152]MDM9624613.1 copper chaperone PCu(A)C [Rhizobium sp. S152]
MKKQTVLTGFLLSCLLAVHAAAGGTKAGDIDIEQPNARAMVPGAKVGGGYLTLTNTGSTDDKLIGINSDRANSAEIHEMSVKNGIMTMRSVAGGLSIPAGQTVELKPGGYHIMFMDVAQPFKQGESIKATLTFEKAGSVDVDFTVGGASGGMKGSQPQMDMSKPQ